MGEQLGTSQACQALDLLAQLRLRTAPHTGEAGRLNTELRTRYRIIGRDGFGRWTARRVIANDKLVAFETRRIVDGPRRRERNGRAG